MEQTIKNAIKKLRLALVSYEEPSERIYLAVPTNPDNFCGFLPKECYYRKTLERTVRMPCGCTTKVHLLGAREEKLMTKYGNFHVTQQPKNDFLLTLFCGNCGKQITEPCSAWMIINTFKGSPKWIKLNSAEFS